MESGAEWSTPSTALRACRRVGGWPATSTPPRDITTRYHQRPRRLSLSERLTSRGLDTTQQCASCGVPARRRASRTSRNCQLPPTFDVVLWYIC